jgi:integrase
MGEKLTDRAIGKLPKPTTGNVIHFDSEVGGLGVRITAAGARSFVLCYRNRAGAGRQRRLTIGAFGEWTIGAARAEARDLKRKIDQGDDPLGMRIANRDAPTVAELCQRFTDEHLPKRRASTRRNYTAAINNQILPKLGGCKVVEIGFTDVDALHRKITKDGAPYQANRTVALFSKMMNLAIRWGWRTDNPCKGIERNDENKRERYLTPDELDRLGKALAKCPDQQGANIIRLLLLTGSRSGEVRSMRWADLDLKGGIWTKPASSTKQRRLHRIPLSAPARDLLEQIRHGATGNAVFVFPSSTAATEHRAELKKAWKWLYKTAKLRNLRVHDLRHSYASILASSGHSLPIIGRLLGHTQPTTTSRYAHLLDDVLRTATEAAGVVISNGNGRH